MFSSLSFSPYQVEADSEFFSDYMISGKPQNYRPTTKLMCPNKHTKRYEAVQDSRFVPTSE